MEKKEGREKKRGKTFQWSFVLSAPVFGGEGFSVPDLFIGDFRS